MASSSDSRGFLSGRLGTTIVAVVITGLVVFVACLLVWHHLGGGAWRSDVSVKSALLLSPDRLVKGGVKTYQRGGAKLYH